MAAMVDAFAALMAMVGGAGAILAGEPALDDGVETAGEAIANQIRVLNNENRRRALGVGVQGTINGARGECSRCI
jgi:hypothetical protein